MSFPILDGFDDYNGATAPQGLAGSWLDVSGGGARTLIAGRFGGQALRMSDATGSTSYIRKLYNGAHSAFSIGLAWKENNVGNLGLQPLIILESATASQLSLYVDTATMTVKLYRGTGTTLLATGLNNAWAGGAYSYFEMYGLLNQTVGWVEVYVDNVFQFRYDGDTCALAGVTMDGVGLNMPDHSGSGNTADYDDFFCDDSSTRYGPSRIEPLRPSADTAQKQFTPQTGPTNYTNVDETLFTTADYVEDSTLNDLDLYDLTDLSTNPATIHAVKPRGLMWKTDAGAREGALVLDSAGTQSVSPNIALSNDARIVEGTALKLNPNGAVAWTPATVNALKLGPKVAA